MRTVLPTDKPTSSESATPRYDSAYGHFAVELTAAIRRGAFGEDLGQNSWLTAEEHRKFFTWLDIDSGSEVLEVASGSGGPALFMARETGCRVTGIDIHEAGIANANGMAATLSLSDRVRFLQADAGERLPFADAAFDAVICIDSMNHLTSAATSLESGSALCAAAAASSSRIRSRSLA
jgi:SAM-dependent methyltransferase